MDTHEQNERIREKNRKAAARAYKNMRDSLENKKEQDSVNAVLRFLNVKGRVDASLPLSEQLEFIEEQYFIRTRYIELEDGWYTSAVLPMLVKTKDGGWTAVIPSPGGTCSYIKNGKKVKVTKKTADDLTGEALCFYKNMGTGRITMKSFIGFMVKCFSKRDAAAVITASVLTSVAGMFLPWVNSFIFARIIPAGVPNGITAAAALLFSAVSTAAVLGLLQSLVLTNIMLRCSVYVQNAVFSRLLSLRPDFFKDAKSGELSEIITEFSDITKLVSARSISSVIAMVLSLVYLIQVGIYAPQLLFWVILSTVILGVLMVSEGVMSSKLMHSRSRSLSKMSGFCYELFSGIEQVKLNGAEARMMRRWSEYYLDAAEYERLPFLLKYSDVFYRLIKVFTTAVIFLFGAQLASSDYIAFSSAYGAYAASCAAAVVIVGMISEFRSSYSLIRPMFEAECENHSSGRKKPETFKGEIAVSDLYFRYRPDCPYVLGGISLNITPGESIGIIGSSGCGKSTLIRLLLGFERAESGSIYIDGFDIRELDLENYRRKIGTVMQNTGLIPGDIYSNITLTKPDAAMDEVMEAIELAGLHDTIAALPMGIHTPVSQENCTLSGGERQRVLIARALISKPSLIIFDEATSALDNITQARITESVNKLDCTKLIVAHRLSTIEQCDRILVMDRGVIVEEGTYEELKNSGGRFWQLTKRQEVR